MGEARSIRRLGFRKWYERELMRSHANLVLLLLATLGLLGSVEVYSAGMALADQLQVLAGALACVVIGLLALRSYLYRLQHAEFVAEQAVCTACNTYAKWELVDEQVGAQMRVRCRRCSHQWTITL